MMLIQLFNDRSYDYSWRWWTRTIQIWVTWVTQIDFCVAQITLSRSRCCLSQSPLCLVVVDVVPCVDDSSNDDGIFSSLFCADTIDPRPWFVWPINRGSDFLIAKMAYSWRRCRPKDFVDYCFRRKDFVVSWMARMKERREWPNGVAFLERR